MITHSKYRVRKFRNKYVIDRTVFSKSGWNRIDALGRSTYDNDIRLKPFHNKRDAEQFIKMLENQDKQLK